MVVEEEQDRLKLMLQETVPMLCRTGLSFSSQCCIEALIGITLDRNDVFLVSIKETVSCDQSENSNQRTNNSLEQSKYVHEQSRHSNFEAKKVSGQGKDFYEHTRNSYEQAVDLTMARRTQTDQPLRNTDQQITLHRKRRRSSEAYHDGFHYDTYNDSTTAKKAKCDDLQASNTAAIPELIAIKPEPVDLLDSSNECKNAQSCDTATSFQHIDLLLDSTLDLLSSRSISHKGRSVSKSDGPILHSEPAISHSNRHISHSERPSLHNNRTISHSGGPILHNDRPIVHSEQTHSNSEKTIFHNDQTVSHCDGSISYNDQGFSHSEQHVLHHDPPVLLNPPLLLDARNVSCNDLSASHYDRPILNIDHPSSHHDRLILYNDGSTSHNTPSILHNEKSTCQSEQIVSHTNWHTIHSEPFNSQADAAASHSDTNTSHSDSSMSHCDAIPKLVTDYERSECNATQPNGSTSQTRSDTGDRPGRHRGSRRGKVWSERSLFRQAAKYIKRLNDNAYICEVCMKPFTADRYAKQHVEFVHLSTNKFTCRYCSYATKRKSDVKKHEDGFCKNRKNPALVLCENAKSTCTSVNDRNNLMIKVEAESVEQANGTNPTDSMENMSA